MAQQLHTTGILPNRSMTERIQTTNFNQKTLTMKRHPLALLICCALIVSSTLYAQSPFIKPGKFSIRAGVGVVPTYFGDKAETNTPPVQMQLGYSFGKKFSLNAFAGYSSATTTSRIFSDGLATHLTNKSLLTGLRGELRHEVSNRVEMYGGGLFGYNRSFIKEYNTATGEEFQRELNAPTPYNPNAPKGQFLYAGFVGANYFVTKNVGVYGEIGYGISLANFGLTFRL